jgi:hypothetical protein
LLLKYRIYTAIILAIMSEAVVPALTEDFIVFDWSDDDDSFDGEVSAPTSSHAVGQPQLFTMGKKRTADEMEAESGYNKKQRIAAESRVTPWAAAVDWDNCRTAADMSVSCYTQIFTNTHRERLQVESRGQRFCGLHFSYSRGA